MNELTPVRARGSLLERASETFDFARIIRENAPDVPKPPPPPVVVAALQPVVETVAEPVGEAFEPAAAAVVTVQRARRTFAGREGMVDREALAEAGFILPDTPAGPLAEEFRIVKRQLLLHASEGQDGVAQPKDRMILVCSAQPDEGKTFCALNLALSLASEKDIEVLLVDADFAKPELVSTLGLESGSGLMDALADPMLDIETCIIRTDILGLSVLPAGRQTHSDTEQIASAHTGTVLKSLLENNPARIIIFDAPPALAASSASVLALHVGQTLMVVRADRTHEAELRDALGLLSGCETIRLLLNGATFAPNGRRFGAYYGYGE